jgi:hypothetical protein
MSWPSIVSRPATRVPSIKSFIRFRQRSNVLLPQPLGPMSAVLRRAAMATLTSNSACLPLYQKFSPVIWMIG